MEGIIKKPSALMIEQSFTRLKPKGKSRKGKKKSIPKGQNVDNGPNCGVAKANKGMSAKPQGKCLHYGMTGH